MFDDSSKGLDKEAFVAGADTLIDLATQSIKNAERGFSLTFAGTPFPGHQIVLDKVEEDDYGTTYFCKALGQEAWLCPALFKYFAKAPRHIYAQFKADKHEDEKCNSWFNRVFKTGGKHGE